MDSIGVLKSDLNPALALETWNLVFHFPNPES